MSEIRNCAREDIPAVAALFQKTFRNTDARAPASLEAHLCDVYLDHPWYDPEVASRVHVNDAGRVTGFVGVFPGRFELGGRPVRAAIAGTLMVEDREADPLAGAKLLRALVKGPQDISISETTNPLSQGLWERLGGVVVPLLSLDWFRVTRPGGAAVAMLAERHPSGAALAPAGWVVDRIGARFLGGHMKPARLPQRVTRQTDASDDEFAAAVRELAGFSALRPAWSDADLGWFLRHAAEKERYGKLHRSIVRNGKDKLIGCYLYHAHAGGTGRVLQVLARARRGRRCRRLPVPRGRRGAAFPAARAHIRTDHQRSADAQLHLSSPCINLVPDRGCRAGGRSGTRRSPGDGPCRRKLDAADRRRVRLKLLPKR